MAWQLLAPPSAPMRHARASWRLWVTLALLIAGCALHPQTRDADQTALDALRAEPVPPAIPKGQGETARGIAHLKAHPPDPSRWRFVFIGDNRNSRKDTHDGEAVFERIMTRTNQLEPSFTLIGGDLTHYSRASEWQRFAQIVGKAKHPVLTAIGNHDAPDRAYYEAVYTPANPVTGLDDYSFDVNDARVIVMDNAAYTFSAAQLGWLDRQLRTSHRFKVVAAHMPPHYGAWTIHAMRPGPANEEFMRICEAGGADFVLLSHIHFYDDAIKRGKTQYIVSGGAGAPLYVLPFGQAVHHLVEIGFEGTHAWHRMVRL